MARWHERVGLEFSGATVAASTRPAGNENHTGSNGRPAPVVWVSARERANVQPTEYWYPADEEMAKRRQQSKLVGQQLRVERDTEQFRPGDQLRVVAVQHDPRLAYKVRSTAADCDSQVQWFTGHSITAAIDSGQLAKVIRKRSRPRRSA